MQVTSPYGNIIHEKENVTHGQFAFTSSEAGNYVVCFYVDQPYTRRGGRSGSGGDLNINLIWKVGVAAKDWDGVARKQRIEVRQ